MESKYYFIRYPDGMNGRSFEKLATAKRWLKKMKYGPSVRVFYYLGGGYVIDVTDKR